ncbi:hypothetical protein AD944_00595 [Acetobacter tropicalis]|uniref:Glycosyltransferase family 2 protein n=5 Tax=Acetobacter tropicalis TaxID=104102 RepID=A0A511FSM2_9PROT|nr:hypothetical protein AD944_00595 [Acetobacter tropicalis]GEL51941.1 hypothetical protein ATR01nite_30160 [Acetobacter tropicalis]
MVLDLKISLIKTVHNTYLCKNLDGKLFSAEEKVLQDYKRVFLIEFKNEYNISFLVSEDIKIIEILCADLKSFILPVEKIINNDGSFFLKVFRKNTVLMATPPHPESKSGFIDGSSTNYNEFEKFFIERIDVINDNIITVAYEIRDIYSCEINCDSIIKYINNYKGLILDVSLCSVQYLISSDDMNVIADFVYGRFDIALKISKKSSIDIWAKKAIPSLVKWKNNKDSHQEYTEKENFLCDADLYFLADVGRDGLFVSFFHSLNFYMRKKIKPSEKTCILTTVRNEGIYLLEWIAYHKALGVEHFFIYSNDNDDSSDQLLECLSALDEITWIENPVKNPVGIQFKAYSHALTILPHILDYKWCFLIDSDEFISLNTRKFHDVNSFLNWISYWATDSIAINWKFIASENVKNLQDVFSPLIERNNTFVDDGVIGHGVRLVKSVFRPQMIMMSSAHHPAISKTTPIVCRLTNGDIHDYKNPPPNLHRDPSFSDVICTENIVINHYFFKSIPEWIWKYSRNGGAFASTEFNLSRFDNDWASYFNMQLNHRSASTHNIEEKFFERFKKELFRLRRNEYLKNAENNVQHSFLKRYEKIIMEIKKFKIKEKIDKKYKFILEEF